MTVAQAIAAVCASEHLREDFVTQLFRQNGNDLISVLTQLSYMSQEQKDKYRYPYQRLCVKTGINEEVCKQTLLECKNDEKVALQYLTIINNTEVKKEITYEMQDSVSTRTGMELHETRRYLEQTNGDVEEAIKIVKSLPNFKRQITYEMQDSVSTRTGMDLHETRRYLEQTNGDVEEAIKIVKSLPNFKRQITYEMQDSVSTRTGMNLHETRKYLEKTNGDVEEAIRVILGATNSSNGKKKVDSHFVIQGNILLKYNGNDEKVIIPENVDCIGREAFYGNSHIRTVILPQNISIEEDAFRDCELLTNISANGEEAVICNVGESAFWGCKNLVTPIVFTGKSIGSNAFYGCSSITRVIINDGVDLGEDAFQDCTMLSHICKEGQTWKAGRISEGAFYGCENLLSNIKVSEKIVRKNAFYNCSSLKMIFLPDFVDLEEDAFQECTSLEHITEKGKRITIAEIGEGAFYSCESLCSNIKLINSLIPTNAFYNCTSLVKIDIPDGADFEEYAFQECTSLKSICEDRSYFAAGKLGKGAFEGCESLVTPIKITDSVLPADVFYNCESLKVVYLPSNITIDKDAFEGCEAKHLSYKELSTSGASNGGRSITGTMEETEDNIIGFQDFIVKTDVYYCRKKGHKLKEVTAIIFCMNAKAEIIEKQVMAGYCKNCQRYYILNREFERLKTNYRVLCRVIDNSVVASGGTGVFADFNQESIIKQYGYTVNQQDGLSTSQRQTILEFLVVAKILTKAEICSHLDWLISSRSYDKHRFRSAISKWSEDRNFISEYQLSENRKVIVRKITKGKMRY